MVVTYNSARDIPRLIDGLRVAASDRAIRLIVVDNDSSDDTVGILRSEQDVVVVESGGNLGYSGGLNVGLSFTGSCDNVLFLNPDLAVAPDTVTRLLEVWARGPGWCRRSADPRGGRRDLPVAAARAVADPVPM